MLKSYLQNTQSGDVLTPVLQTLPATRVSVVHGEDRSGHDRLKEEAAPILHRLMGRIKNFVNARRQNADLGTSQADTASTWIENVFVRYTRNFNIELLDLEVHLKYVGEKKASLLVMYNGNCVAMFDLDKIAFGQYIPTFVRALSKSDWGTIPLPTAQYRTHKDRVWCVLPVEVNDGVVTKTNHTVHVFNSKQLLTSEPSNLGSIYAPISFAVGDSLYFSGQTYTYSVDPSSGPKLTVSGSFDACTLALTASGLAYSEVVVQSYVCVLAIGNGFRNPYTLETDTPNWGYTQPNIRYYELEDNVKYMVTLNGERTLNWGSEVINTIPFIHIKQINGLDVCSADYTTFSATYTPDGYYRSRIEFSEHTISTHDYPDEGWCTGNPIQTTTTGSGESFNVAPFPYPVTVGNTTRFFYSRSDSQDSIVSWSVVTPYETVDGVRATVTLTEGTRIHKNDGVFLIDEGEALVVSGSHNYRPALVAGPECTAWEGHLYAQGLEDLGVICVNPDGVYCIGWVQHWSFSTNSWVAGTGKYSTNITYVPYSEVHMRISGWLQLSNGTHMIQGYSVGVEGDALFDLRAFIAGKSENIAAGIAASLGVTENNIQAMLMDIPLAFVETLK